MSSRFLHKNKKFFQTRFRNHDTGKHGEGTGVVPCRIRGKRKTRYLAGSGVTSSCSQTVKYDL